MEIRDTCGLGRAVHFWWTAAQNIAIRPLERICLVEHGV